MRKLKESVGHLLMEKNNFSKLDIIQYFLAGFIVFSLMASVLLDFKQQKEVNFEKIRKELAFVDLLALEDYDSQVSKQQLNKYLRYFQMVDKRDGLTADAKAMIGFCYYHLGQKDKARSVYQEALHLNPKFFAFVYNIAVLDFQDGRYRQALDGFKTALAISPSESIIFLRNFKNFLYIIYKTGLLNSSLSERFKKEYALSAHFAGICSEKLKDEKQAIFFRQQSLNIGDVPKQQQPRLRIF